MGTLEHHIIVERAYKLFEAGNHTDARHSAEQALKNQKNDLQALHLMGMIYYARAEYGVCEKYVRRCLSIRPKDPLLNYEMARVMASLGRYSEAITQFDKTISLQPGYIQAIAGKADVLEKRGDRDAAREVLAPLIERGGLEDDGVAAVHIRLLEDAGQIKQAAELARELLKKPAADPHSRNLLLQEVGRMHDRLGNYEEAFYAFSDAKAHGRWTFRADEYIEEFDTLIATFSSRNLAMIPHASNRSEVPVFIACMPRSGSTLIEQIIHAHPKVFGGGELNHITEMAVNLAERIGSFQPYPACLADLTQVKADQLAESYLAVLKKLDPKALRVTNKDVVLYKQLGLISLLFPKARIIHIRRDRLDNGFACFMAGLSPQLFPWVSDLKHIGIAWRQYERLMEHWKSVITLPWLDVQYEELVDDTENQIRRIIDFCGLEWNDKCLRYWEVTDRNVMTLSYDQVRRPIFKTAVKRHEKYAAFLGPLKEALG